MPEDRLWSRGCTICTREYVTLPLLLCCFPRRGPSHHFSPGLTCPLFLSILFALTSSGNFFLNSFYLILAGLGLCCCTQAFSSCSVQALHCGHFSCCGVWALGPWHMGFHSCSPLDLELRFSSCGAQAQLLHGMWDLPGPGIELMTPALAGEFSSIVPLHKGSPLLGAWVQIHPLTLPAHPQPSHLQHHPGYTTQHGPSPTSAQSNDARSSTETRSAPAFITTPLSLFPGSSLA